MQTELFPDPVQPPGAPPPHPDGRVILLDLNATLSANAELRHTTRPFQRFIDHVETYRAWLVDLLRQETVVLITVRDDRYRGSTLARIDRLHEWQPTLALFNSFGMPSADAAPIKRRHMLESVYPAYGDDPGRYLALESNWKTRAMYARLGVPAVRVNPEKQWTSLPHPKLPTTT